jgi:hypothetical protein
MWHRSLRSRTGTYWARVYGYGYRGGDGSIVIVKRALTHETNWEATNLHAAERSLLERESERGEAEGIRCIR